ncbi:hypothetical protein EDD16DRAFT_1617233 [Pisolithus croceorrhizus]|nr:hypothetical protein EDD16DRAFT_1617233 [Pisolithus croceorrhizus]
MVGHITVPVTSQQEIIGCTYKIFIVAVTNGQIVLKSEGSVPHPGVTRSRAHYRPNAVQQTTRNIQHSMGKVPSRLRRRVSFKMGKPPPLLRLISPYIINLDDDIDEGHTTVVRVGRSRILQGTLHSSNITIAVKTRVPRDATAVKVKASRNHAVDEINIWSQLRHENIMPLLGITTKFDNTVSMVTEWMERGNAHRYVQNMAVDPRPLVCQS